MGKQKRKGNQSEKRLRLRSIRHDPPNLDRLTNALLDMALRRAAQEQEARVQGQKQHPSGAEVENA